MLELLNNLGKDGLRSASCMLGLSVNILIIAITLPFFSVPSGDSIRPMLWVVQVVWISAVALALGVCAVLWDWYRGRFTSGIIGLFLCLLPLPFTSQLLKVIALVKGFYLGD